jgi:tetratricopeptide (TPR) repeat protein
VKLAPNNPEIVKGLVSALAAVGRTTDAIEGLEQALRRQPLWTDGHVLLASMRWASGEREGFTRSYDEALAQNPNSLDLRREQRSRPEAGISTMRRRAWIRAAAHILFASQGSDPVGEAKVEQRFCPS